MDFDAPDAVGLPDAATFQNAALGLALTYDRGLDIAFTDEDSVVFIQIGERF